MKSKTFKRISLFVLALSTSAAINTSHAQVFKKKIDEVQTDKARKDKTEDRRKSTVYRTRRHNSYERRRSNLPPGQAKKVYGEKSARDFAPGHQKKHYTGKKHKKAKVYRRERD